MSVINKVLRDLDKRHGALRERATSDDLGARIGTSSVDLSQTAERPRSAAHTRWAGVVLPGTVVAALAAAGGLWYQGALDAVLPPFDHAAPAAVPLPPPAPVTTVAQAVQAPASTPQPAASAPELPQIELAPASRFESTLVLPKDLQLAEPAKTAVTPPVKSPAAQTAARAPAQVAPAPAAGPQAVAASTSAPLESAPRQSLAGREALAHAQSLWSAGSRDAAIELLQQAVASAERAATGTPGPATTQTLVLLVRELGRMQLSEGRPGAVWETQTRLEPLLRNEPDMWALRANAAQRLGRHQDSVLAYTTALQSRPTEQRWLLGAAVSLAALGQIASSTEMAEKARAVGPISRDVLSYLRQMGVAVKD